VAGQLLDGPEIMNVPKGAQIFPNGSLPVNDKGRRTPLYAPIYNATGVGDDIDRLRAQMAKDRANFACKAIATVKKAQAGRQL
jgi:hypothetical protein